MTTFENLSVYVRDQPRRRKVDENAKRKRIENYESSNDDCVVEDFSLVDFAENTDLVDADVDARLVLLVVAAVGAYFYASWSQLRVERDQLAHWADATCSAAGVPFAASTERRVDTAG